MVSVGMNPDALFYVCEEDPATESEIQESFVRDAISFAIDVWPLEDVLEGWMMEYKGSNAQVALAQMINSSKMGILIEVEDPHNMNVGDNSSRDSSIYQNFDLPFNRSRGLREFIRGTAKVIKNSLRKGVQEKLCREIHGIIMPVIDLRSNFKDPSGHGSYISIWLQDGEALFSVGDNKFDMPVVTSQIQKQAEQRYRGLMDSIDSHGRNIDYF